jgi:translocator protein
VGSGGIGLGATSTMEHNRLMGTRGKDVVGVLAVVSLTIAVAVVGGAAGDFRSKWYTQLRKPAWQPSGAAIGGVWSVLYVTIATAGSMLWLQRRRASPAVAALFVAQSLLNAAWTVLFTRAKSPALATADCAALTAVNAGLVASAWPARRTAAVLLVPYLLWTAFATFLSWTIYRLNSSQSDLAASKSSRRHHQ